MELREYILLIKRRLWVLLVITMISITCTAIYINYFCDNIYESITTLYVGSQTREESGIAYNDLLMGQFLVKDYKEIAKSRSVVQQVVDELILEGELTPDFDPLSLSKKISVNLRGDTRVIEIKLEDTDPYRAKVLADRIAVVFREKVNQLIKIDNIEIIDEANLPEKHSKPKKARDIATAAFIGVLAGLGTVFLIEYLDNTIKSPEDVEKYLELPILGVVPQIDQ